MKNRNLNHSDNWATPKELYDKLDAEFNFDFDPCPLSEIEITPENDGLLKEWGNSNFINPPYSRSLKEAFVKKAVLEASKGKTCVMLLPVSTSTKLFHEVILPNAKDIRFLKGRVKFLGINTKGEYVTNKAPMHDSMIVIFGTSNVHNTLTLTELGNFVDWIRELDFKKYAEGWCEAGGSNGWHCTDKELLQMFKSNILK